MKFVSALLLGLPASSFLLSPDIVDPNNITTIEQAKLALEQYRARLNQSQTAYDRTRDQSAKMEAAKADYKNAVEKAAKLKAGVEKQEELSSMAADPAKIKQIAESLRLFYHAYGMEMIGDPITAKLPDKDEIVKHLKNSMKDKDAEFLKLAKEYDESRASKHENSTLMRLAHEAKEESEFATKMLGYFQLYPAHMEKLMKLRADLLAERKKKPAAPGKPGTDSQAYSAISSEVARLKALVDEYHSSGADLTSPRPEDLDEYPKMIKKAEAKLAELQKASQGRHVGRAPDTVLEPTDDKVRACEGLIKGDNASRWDNVCRKFCTSLYELCKGIEGLDYAKCILQTSPPGTCVLSA